MVAPFDGGYREWRAAVTEGWTAEDELARRPGARGRVRPPATAAGRRLVAHAWPSPATASRTATAAHSTGARRRRSRGQDGRDRAGSLPRLSKDAYRRERARIEADLARLGERKMTLESGLSEPAVQANFVELRRLSSELAEVDAALDLAEDAWLTLEERAPHERGEGGGHRGDGGPGRRAPVIIGLTGPIGCGKSTVAGMLAELGGVVIDADDLAREVTAPGQPALAAIHARFGEAVFRPPGVLDRAALAAIVFADPAALADLEAIVHPAVRVRIEARLEQARREGDPFVVIEAIKLVESGLGGALRRGLAHRLPAGDRSAQRLASRGMDAADIERRLATQGAGPR